MNNIFEKLKELLKPFLYDHNRPTQEEVDQKQRELDNDWIVTKGCGKFLVFENLNENK